MQCTDPVIFNLWHPLAAVAETVVGVVHTTTLLGERVGFALDTSGGVAAWRARPGLPERGPVRIEDVPDLLPTRVRYGYVWSSLGAPDGELFAIPEYDEPDRRNMNASTIGMHVSAPRAIENFLDMGHFPFVHTGVLGAEPHTEVREYDVEVSAERDEILATECRMFQPKAAAASSAGARRRVRVPGAASVLRRAVQVRRPRPGPPRRDRGLLAAGRRGTHPRPHVAVGARPRARGQGDPQLPADRSSARTSRSWRTSTRSGCRWTHGPKRRSAPTSRRSPTGVG